MKINFKKLIVCIGVPLLAGGLSALITRGDMSQFDTLTKPPFTPPAIVFPIVWSILYLLMGIASYIVCTSQSYTRTVAIRVYGLQLIFNVIWPIIFFSFSMYVFAFIWLVILLLLVLITAALFYSIEKWAGYLLAPYILWLVIAGYLNLGIVLLN